MKKISILCLAVLAVIVVFFSSNSAMAYNKLKMVNHTGRTIKSVYFVPVPNSGVWGPDILNGVWNSGESITLSTAGSRHWAVKIHFDQYDYYVWDGDSSIDSDSLYQVTFISNGKGGYRMLYNQ